MRRGVVVDQSGRGPNQALQQTGAASALLKVLRSLGVPAAELRLQFNASLKSEEGTKKSGFPSADADDKKFNSHPVVPNDS